MSTTVNRSDEVVEKTVPQEPVKGPAAGYQRYRSVSRLAVIALVLTILSITAYWVPLMILTLVVPALILGFVARRGIKKYPDELIGIVPANLATFGSMFILLSSMSLHAYIYATEVPEGYQRITFYDLDPEPGSHLPVSQKAIELVGENVFIKGFTYPGTGKRTDMTSFVLVRDRGTCCFGGQPDDSDMILVKLTDGQTIDYSLRQRKLAGKFSVDQRKRSVGDIKTGFYRLEADYLK